MDHLKTPRYFGASPLCPKFYFAKASSCHVEYKKMLAGYLLRSMHICRCMCTRMCGCMGVLRPQFLLYNVLGRVRGKARKSVIRRRPAGSLKSLRAPVHFPLSCNRRSAASTTRTHPRSLASFPPGNTPGIERERKKERIDKVMIYSRGHWPSQ